MLNDELLSCSLVENASLLSMGLLPKSKKNEDGSVACTKNTNSSFTSTMLCFLHFNDGNEKNNKDQKQSRFRLLRKSRSSSNFNTQNSTSMVVPQRTHCRTQSAVLGGVATLQNDVAKATAASTSSLQKSPVHLGLFTKVDKSSLKLSTSSPTMTNETAIPTTPKDTEEINLPTTSKSRQKKFHRHFPMVENDEKVLNYYSCALIGDILLQGNLYITKNYFAFYSNVFGYVTKLLIPMLTVDKITKEKTARIIPNAVGITTSDGKHVFGSLMSRDNTYKFMVKIWEMSMKKTNVEPQILTNPEILETAATDSDSSETKEIESTAQLFEIHSTNNISNSAKTPFLDDPEYRGYFLMKLLQGYKSVLKMPKQTLFLLAATLLLIVLFLSASLLMFRISKIHDKYLSLIEDHIQPMTSNDEIFQRILKFSNDLHSKSANSINDLIDSNLHEIARISENLETLSSILMPKDTSSEAKDSTLKDAS